MRKLTNIKYDGKVNKIYHIADIHIRNLKRHQEYKEVFERLYKYISDTKTEDAIIVLAGDIVHAKTDMTPEVIEMTQSFLKALSDLLPTVLIPGNHDANLNNPSRLDALTPIVNALNHPNLHYLKDDGVWSMGGITFSHSSVFGESKEIIPSGEVNGDYKIALYHGPVDRVETEHGFQIENKNVNVESFDGYDLVLLGDIHVPNQSLNSEGTISYVGSLIMQNHGEAKYPEHGILVWDVTTKESKFVPIHNDYGYVTVDVEGGKIIGDINIPNKPRMRVRVKDTTQSDLKKILSDIRVGRSVQEVAIQKIITDTKDSDGKSSTILQNVRDVGFQNKLIEDYISDRFIVSAEHLDVIRGINTDINSKLAPVVGLKNVMWKPKTFEFSNMFSYGSDNVIKFTNMKGTYGIFAPNASGKSSLWDALSFCIFDKCSRTTRAVDVMNYAKNTFDCKFNFEINGVDYFIERVATKSPKRGTVKVDVDFYRINEDGTVESLNGEERRDTNSMIRQYVGSYEDFTLTAMSNQSESSGFIEKSQKERKELLAQFLDMDVFEELYDVANTEIKELSTLLKDYKNQNFTEKLSEAKDSLVINESLLSCVQSKLTKNRTSKTMIASQIELLIKKLISVDSTIIDIDKLHILKDSLNDDLDLKVTECGEYTESLSSTLDNLSKLETEFDSYNYFDLKAKYIKFELYAKMKTDIQTEMDNLDLDITHKQKHLDGIGSLSFDDDCNHCVTNKNTPFAKQAQSLETEIVELTNLKESKKVKLEEASLNKEKFDVTSTLTKAQSLKVSIADYENKIDRLELESKSCNLELTELQTRKNGINADIQKSIEQRESVEHNATIQIEIDGWKERLIEIENLIDETNDELLDVSGNIRIAKNTIETVNDSINKLDHMERKYEGYEYYLKCVKRDGIPYELISNVLPKLEVEINNILQPIVDFQILLNTDGKNINSYIAYGDEQFWPLELTSGMEKFISSVAIRTALINVSNLPRPNFIAIDEGFGSLDSDNFNSLYLLFDYLKSQFDFLVTISHIDKTRDMVDQIIDISKVDGFSSIRYL